MFMSSVVFRPRVAMAAAAGVLLLGSGAWAQQLPQFDLNQLELNSAATGTTVVGTGELLPPGTLRGALAFSYDDSPVVYFEPGGTFVGDVVSGRFTLHAVGAWAPFDWLEFSADVPIIAAQDGYDLTEYGIPRAARTGIGNPVVTTRLGLAAERAGAPVDLAVQVGARLPMGVRGQWIAEQRLVMAPKLMLGKSLGWVRAGAEVGVRWNPDAERSTNFVQLAAVAQSGSREGLRVELSGRTSVNFTGQRTAADVFLGARYPFSGLEVFALAGPYFQNGLRAGVRDWIEGRGAPPFRVMMGLTFGSGAPVAAPPPGPLAPSPGPQPAYTEAAPPGQPPPPPGPAETALPEQVAQPAPAAPSPALAVPAAGFAPAVAVPVSGSTGGTAATAGGAQPAPAASAPEGKGARASGPASPAGSAPAQGAGITTVTVPTADGRQIAVPVPAGYTLVPVAPPPPAEQKAAPRQ